jgi:hypothetical protein
MHSIFPFCGKESGVLPCYMGFGNCQLGVLWRGFLHPLIPLGGGGGVDHPSAQPVSPRQAYCYSVPPVTLTYCPLLADPDLLPCTC